MVSDAFLDIVALCSVCFLCCISTGRTCNLSVVVALHSALLWGGRAERYSLPRPTVRVSLVGVVHLIDILIVGYLYARLNRHVPHRRIASAVSAIFLALWGTLRRPLAPQRGVV